MLFRSCFQHLDRIERQRIITAKNTRLRLNRGERPEALSEEFRRHIRARLRLTELHQYPSYPAFYDKLARWLDVHVESIVVGAGIEEFIRTLMFLSCDPGEKAAVVWPSCAMYDIYAAAFGVDLVQIKAVPGDYFGMADLINQIPEDTRIVFLPNPGQPVETYFPLKMLPFLLDYCREIDAVLAIDEAHYGFGAETALPLIGMSDNLVVLRTFSKFMSAASIRVGFAVGDQPVIRALDAVRPSGEVTGLSMQVASMLIDNESSLKESALKIAEARDWLRDKINRDYPGLKAYGAYGFSVLIEFPDIQAALSTRDGLAAQGIYVKGGFPPPVEKCLLVACGTRPVMEQFEEALRMGMEV